MKLLFLACQQEEIRCTGAVYDFLPYKYGPYSFTADRDLVNLMSEGLVWGEMLSIKGEERVRALELYSSLAETVQRRVKDLVESYREVSDQKLICYVYERYPQYTVLSELREAPVPRYVATPAIYTMGYEGTSIDAFLHALVLHGISRVLDVRQNPVSRRYGFSKSKFATLCEKIGVDYHHFPELGIPSEERRNLSDFASYQTLFNIYEVEMLPKHRHCVSAASALIEVSASVLMCFEADPNYCHRSHLAQEISRMSGLPVNHLEVCNG